MSRKARGLAVALAAAVLALPAVGLAKHVADRGSSVRVADPAPFEPDTTAWGQPPSNG